MAESEGPGKGSRFVITLPLPPRAQEELSPENGPSGARSLVRALIVDDNIDAAETLSLLLNLGGHTTALAHDGAEALKVAAEFNFTATQIIGSLAPDYPQRLSSVRPLFSKCRRAA